MTKKNVRNIEHRDLPHYKGKEETNKVSVIKRHVTDNNEVFKIDIESLVDNCFTEEFENIKPNTLPFKKRRTVHQFEFVTLAINKNQNLNVHFTFEEEFRLHDLIVRRDHLDEEKLKRMTMHLFVCFLSYYIHIHLNVIPIYKQLKSHKTII